MKELAAKLPAAEAHIEALSTNTASSDELTDLQKRHKQLTATLKGLAKKHAVSEAIEVNQAFSGLGPIYPSHLNHDK